MGISTKLYDWGLLKVLGEGEKGKFMFSEPACKADSDGSYEFSKMLHQLVAALAVLCKKLSRISSLYQEGARSCNSSPFFGFNM
jgi:hypothetical protein